MFSQNSSCISVGDTLFFRIFGMTGSQDIVFLGESQVFFSLFSSLVFLLDLR